MILTPTTVQQITDRSLRRCLGAMALPGNPIAPALPGVKAEAVVEDDDDDTLSPRAKRRRLELFDMTTREIDDCTHRLAAATKVVDKRKVEYEHAETRLANARRDLDALLDAPSLRKWPSVSNRFKTIEEKLWLRLKGASNIRMRKGGPQTTRGPPEDMARNWKHRDTWPLEKIQLEIFIYTEKDVTKGAEEEEGAEEGADRLCKLTCTIAEYGPLACSANPACRTPADNIVCRLNINAKLPLRRLVECIAWRKRVDMEYKTTARVSAHGCLTANMIDARHAAGLEIMNDELWEFGGRNST